MIAITKALRGRFAIGSLPLAQLPVQDRRAATGAPVNGALGITNQLRCVDGAAMEFGRASRSEFSPLTADGPHKPSNSLRRDDARGSLEAGQVDPS